MQSNSLLVVHVHVHVKPECVAAFQAATLANARASLQEPGIARFDVTQQADDPTRFVVLSKPVVAVKKTVVDENGAPVEPGDRLTWTIVATNTGDRTATGVVVTDRPDEDHLGSGSGSGTDGSSVRS